MKFILLIHHFKWSNLASHNAGVTVVIVGISKENIGKLRLIYLMKTEKLLKKSKLILMHI